MQDSRLSTWYNRVQRMGRLRTERLSQGHRTTRLSNLACSGVWVLLWPLPVGRKQRTASSNGSKSGASRFCGACLSSWTYRIDTASNNESFVPIRLRLSQAHQSSCGPLYTLSRGIRSRRIEAVSGRSNQCGSPAGRSRSTIPTGSLNNYVADHIRFLLWRSPLCGAGIRGSYENAPNRLRGLHNSIRGVVSGGRVRYGLICNTSPIGFCPILRFCAADAARTAIGKRRTTYRYLSIRNRQGHSTS